MYIELKGRRLVFRWKKKGECVSSSVEYCTAARSIYFLVVVVQWAETRSDLMEEDSPLLCVRWRRLGDFWSDALTPAVVPIAVRGNNDDDE